VRAMTRKPVHTRVVPRIGAFVDASNRLRAFADPAGKAYTSTTPTRAITAFVDAHERELQLTSVGLAQPKVKRGERTHVRLSQQKLHGLKVLGSELRVVADTRRNAVLAAYNTLDYDTASAPPPSAALPVDALETAALSALAGHHDRLEIVSSETAYLRFSERPPVVDSGSGQPAAAIFASGAQADGALHLVREVKINAFGPRWVYRAVVDAASGALLFIESLARSATATLYAYSPDPVTSSDDGTLGPTSTDADLNGERAEFQVEIDEQSGGKYHLEGDYFTAVNLEIPDFAQPAESSASFKYNATSQAFLSANAYYWLDTYTRRLLSLGVQELNDNWPGEIRFDAQAENGADNSHYYPGATPEITYGEGGVPDAADMAVVCHELTHGVCDYVGSNQGGNAGYEHSWCDALPVIFRDRYNTLRVRRRMVFPFDNVGNFWSSVRDLGRAERFDDAGFAGYQSDLKQSMLGTAFFDCYDGIGGDSDHAGVREDAGDKMLRNLIETLVVLPDNAAITVAAAETIADATITVDLALTGGLHSKVFYDAYVARGLYDEREVDVYIRDSAADTGGHPSPIPHWSSPDIWVRNNPPPADPNDPTDPNAGEDYMAGHQAPIVGVPNYMYVRVHNKGSQPGTGFSVDAYHCDPGTGMTWPEHFTLMGTLAVQGAIAANGGSVVVGPFSWTPEVEDHECLLAIARGDDDPSIADTVTGSVPHWQLVRFDNNVGQRNVKPVNTVIGGKTTTTFFMRGKSAGTSTNDLQIDTRALPADTHIEVKLLRRITDGATLQHLTVVSQSTLWTTLELAGGVVAAISGFELQANDKVGVTLEIDFSMNAQHGQVYPIIATQVLDGMVAGRMTIEITAIKETDDYIWGNRRSRELHELGCAFWKMVSHANKIPFLNVGEALARGYNGCRFCMPEFDTD
jgi:hypothetical protein